MTELEAQLTAVWRVFRAVVDTPEARPEEELVGLLRAELASARASEPAFPLEDMPEWALTATRSFLAAWPEDRARDAA